MARWAVFLACWAIAGAGAHELEQQHTHGFFVPEDPTEPPIEPPPVEPPPAGGHFERACSQPDTGCNALTSMEADQSTYNRGIWNADVDMTSVPNSPTNPERKGQCTWNGGTQFCAEYFQQGDCSQRPDPRSNETLADSRGYSPCYDADVGAMRANYWADRGSSIIHARVMRTDLAVHAEAVWMQFELLISEGMFRTPAGSSTAKLARMYHQKAECTQPHVYSHRWGFSPTEIWFGWVAPCEGNDIHPGDMADRPKVPRADAGKWVRVTAGMDLAARRFYLSVIRVEDGHVYGRWEQDAHPNSPDFVLLSEWRLPMIHSTQHEPEPGCDSTVPGGADACGPSPAFWLRNAIVSLHPIAEH